MNSKNSSSRKSPTTMNAFQRSCRIPHFLSVACAGMFLLSPLTVTAQTWIGDALDSPGCEWYSQGYASGYAGSWSILDSLSASHDGVDGVSMVVFPSHDQYSSPGDPIPFAHAQVYGTATVSVPSVCWFWYQRPYSNMGSYAMSQFVWGSTGIWLPYTGIVWERAIIDIQSGVQDYFQFSLHASVYDPWPPTYEYLSVDQFTIEPMPGLSISDASVAEGNDGTAALDFTVSLEHAVSFDVSAKVGVSGGNADYLDPPNSVLVPMGATQVQLIIPVVGDTLYEGDEQIQVQLTSPQHAFLTDPVAVGTIIDDDFPPTQLGIRLVGGGARLSWDTVVGFTYTLQTGTGLLSPEGWSDLPPYVNLPGSGGTSSVTLALDSAKRFFRIKTTTATP